MRIELIVSITNMGAFLIFIFSFKAIRNGDENHGSVCVQMPFRCILFLSMCITQIRMNRTWFIFIKFNKMLIVNILQLEQRIWRNKIGAVWWGFVWTINRHWPCNFLFYRRIKSKKYMPTVCKPAGFHIYKIQNEK